MHDTLRPRVLRFFALLMIAGAGANVLPHVAAASVGNCLSLLDATQPFMIKAGCSRLRLLMRLDAARARAVAAGAAAKLLRVVQAPDADAGARRCLGADLAVCGTGTSCGGLANTGGCSRAQACLAHARQRPLPQRPCCRLLCAGVVDYALAALEDLCACQEGLESLREAGGAAGLQAFLAGAGGGAAAEDAAQRARRLLAALDRLGDLPAF